jgi:hypothetical protein
MYSSSMVCPVIEPVEACAASCKRTELRNCARCYFGDGVVGSLVDAVMEVCKVRACVACLRPCLIDSWPLIMRGSVDALVLVAEGFKGFKGFKGDLFTCLVLVCPDSDGFCASVSSNPCGLTRA